MLENANELIVTKSRLVDIQELWGTEGMEKVGGSRGIKGLRKSVGEVGVTVIFTTLLW